MRIADVKGLSSLLYLVMLPFSAGSSEGNSVNRWWNTRLKWNVNRTTSITIRRTRLCLSLLMTQGLHSEKELIPTENFKCSAVWKPCNYSASYKGRHLPTGVFGRVKNFLAARRVQYFEWIFQNCPLEFLPVFKATRRQITLCTFLFIRDRLLIVQNFLWRNRSFLFCVWMLCYH